MKQWQSKGEIAAVLPWQGTNVWLFHLTMVFASVLLPAAAHLSGAPVRWILPMHWPIIFAGLIYGWRGGLVVGLLAPCTNWLLTGYPLPIKLLPMTVELGVYGFAAGWFTQHMRLSRVVSLTLALIVGRIVFLGMILATGAAIEGFGPYLVAAMIPGIPVAVLQIISLPLLAKWWVEKNRNS